MKYCDIKKKMDKKDSLGLWDDKTLIFTAADMHKMLTVSDGQTREYFENQIAHMMSEHEVFQEFEKRAAHITREMNKLREEKPDQIDLLLLQQTRLTECRIMQGLFQSLFTLKYLEEGGEEE